MRALGVALATTLAITVAGYLSLLAIGATVGSWSGEVVGQQARALLLHFAIVAVRGILPVVAGTAVLRAVLAAALPGWAERHPGLVRTGAALVSAGIVVPALLPLAIGPLPRLRIEGPVNLGASVVLLAGVCAVGWWLGVDRRAARSGTSSSR